MIWRRTQTSTVIVMTSSKTEHKETSVIKTSRTSVLKQQRKQIQK